MSTDPEQTMLNVVAFRDSEGNYYVLPWDTVQQGRIKAEQVPAFEQMLNEQGDASGFYMGRGAPLPILPNTGAGTPPPLGSVGTPIQANYWVLVTMAESRYSVGFSPF